ncbi:hypothetical protein AU184_26355 [Mycolicibacterium novocastrense]|nr:hypothetical protein AU183_00090 [Mycolicibacterium novocastrense]KUH68195.1 hypothetical protein AU184_26355 [Mycolicibacterium novocastrense]KUH74393.1 hypothetical protein AU072_17390 [Mycolicibacterium novocastrense]
MQATVRGQLTEFRGSEIVFSAGALRTPQLLMLSGIGPASHLREWGIEVRMDLPGVGANLTDHPELSVPWTFRGRHPAMPGRGMLTSALHWTADGSDKPGDLEILPFVATTAQMMRIANMMRNPLNTAKMIRNTSLSLVLSQARTMRLPFIVIGLQQPNSRGSVKLAAADPTVAPQLHWNVFAEEADRRRFREAITVTSAIFEASSMRAIGASLKGLGPNDLRSNASLDVWMNEHIFTVGHASGTCRMGPSSDPDAVADQYGRVHGVENLRICDQSLFPEIPSRGPNATAIMLGERMAEFFERDAV